MKNRTHILKYLKFYNVLKCSKKLNTISKIKNIKKRTKIIREAEDCVIDAISEIAKNCLNGNIPLKTCDFEKLSKYHLILKRLSRKSKAGQRKNLIIQTGGFINLLIPAALALISSVVGDIIKKKVIK